MAMDSLAIILACAIVGGEGASPAGVHEGHRHVDFTVRSVKSGAWSDPATWDQGRVPAAGDRVRVSRGTTVIYDAASDAVLRLVQVVGTLRFARDRDTLLAVCVLKVQSSDACSESGFACDFEEVNRVGEPQQARSGQMPALEIGTLEDPLPAQYTARIRLSHLGGFDPQDAPALVCCSARMDLHGAPMSRTWVKLGQDVRPGQTSVVLAEPVTGWRVGDEVIVTGSKRVPGAQRRADPNAASTEARRITGIEGQTVRLDQPLRHDHYGSGEFRSEIANLSRNVVIESADSAGHRGHTLYHAYSRGGISYVRFAHLGKKGVLGRYAIHYHLVGDTMRGSQILGAAIVDSHNRWITIHGTEYLVVRDCIGYQSVGHGFFMEDGTEVYNLLDRNLGVHAYRARALPKQVLPFDPNDGAAFWWANGRNTLVRNVACENEEYGFRYDMQRSRSFDSTLPVTMPDGESRELDVRTIPVWRFEDNETHTEGLYGVVIAANGNQQPDTPIRDQQTLDRIRAIDWTGPDARHPHIVRRLKIWEAHYAFRPHSPSMLMEDIRIHRVGYGIYRPALDNHVYRNVHLSDAGAEPFNRAMDDASAQAGQVSVDGLVIADFRGGNQGHPVVHMSDNNLSGQAACHFRRVSFDPSEKRRPVFNRGGSVRVDPFLPQGVPYYVHDYFGPGRHAKIVSTKAKDLLGDGRQYRSLPPLTGDESVVAEVTDVSWPALLDPVDDLPPATIVTGVRRQGEQIVVAGISHDNGEITAVTVNGAQAKILARNAGVVDWEATLPAAGTQRLAAFAADQAGNVERTPHELGIDGT